MVKPIQHPKKDNLGKPYIWLSTSLLNPPGLTVLIDTGALAEGEYEAIAHLGGDGISNMRCDLEHRNAANTATFSFSHMSCRNVSIQQIVRKMSIGANERIRIRTIGNSINTIYASLMYRQVG